MRTINAIHEPAETEPTRPPFWGLGFRLRRDGPAIGGEVDPGQGRNPRPLGLLRGFGGIHGFARDRRLMGAHLGTTTRAFAETSSVAESQTPLMVAESPTPRMVAEPPTPLMVAGLLPESEMAVNLPNLRPDRSRRVAIYADTFSRRL